MSEQRNRTSRGSLRRWLITALGLAAVGAVLGIAGGGLVGGSTAEAANAPAFGFPALSSCSPGYWSASAGQPCTPAPIGSIVPTAGATSYTLCNLGAYQDQPAQTVCKPSPAGSFVGDTGASQSTPCTLGHYQPSVGKSFCLDAPAGSRVFITGAVEALPCPVGSYQDLTAQSSCKPAPVGSVVATSGAIATTPCYIGYYQDLTGQSSCKPAPIGSAVGVGGASHPVQCTPGYFQGGVGHSYCNAAPAGTYVTAFGQSAPIDCPPGLFQDQQHQTMCKPSLPGSFVASWGAVAATPCAPGSYEEFWESKGCSPAPVGFFVDQSGATAPTECAPGTTTVLVGQTACSFIVAPPGPGVGSVPLFIPVSPFRVADTRSTGRIGSPDGTAAPLKFKVTGQGGLPATGVSAVSLNVTVVDGGAPTSGGGYVTVDACNTPRPDASNLNFTAGQTIPNAVITPVSATGDVCVYVYGTANILVDINGYFPTGSAFGAVSPFRVADTRSTGRIGSPDGTAAPLKFKVTGQGGLPATGVSAVSLNVTVVDGGAPTSGGGYVTVDACNTPRPDASNLNFTAGQTIPNAVITPVSATGDVCVYVYGTANILVDINGYFPTGSAFGAVSPFRVADTRSTGRIGSPDGTAAPLKFKVTGQGGLPATGVSAVSLNVTVVDGGAPTSGGGYVTVDACNTPRPDASNLNFTAGQTIPNAVITPVSATGDVCVYVYGTANILVDINGYFPVT